MLLTQLKQCSVLENHLTAWKRDDDLLHVPNNLKDIGDVSFFMQAHLLKLLIQSRAFEHGPPVQVDDIDRPIAEALQQQGIVTEVIDGNGVSAGWALTSEGAWRCAHGVCLWELNSPQPLYQVPANVKALTDAKAWEMIKALEQDGWTAKPWVPKSRRPKKEREIALNYEPGGDKIFFLTNDTCKLQL